MEPIGILTPRAILVRGGESGPLSVVFDVPVWVELVEVGFRAGVPATGAGVGSIRAVPAVFAAGYTVVVVSLSPLATSKPKPRQGMPRWSRKTDIIEWISVPMSGTT